MLYSDGLKQYNTLKENDEIVHKEFGKGKIVRRNCEMCEIDFNGDKKTMNLKTLLEHGHIETPNTLQ